MQREVADYVLQLPVSGGSKHNYLTAYLQLLRYAEARPDRYLLDAYATVDRLRPRKRPLIPSYQTCVAAIGACRNSRFRALVALCFYAGLRLDEARSLRWSQVDLPNRLLIVEEAEKRSEGSTLPIPDALAAILQSTPRREDDPYVCRISPRSAWRCMTFLKRRLVKAGFQDAVYLSFKNVRHVFATYHYS
ncbi:MAG: tyrosine-type recombinase/integrase, partial [Candidatus Caldarchaeum sp.]|nr:tyrosine-type recombinase/integrase [Candidatus Caldarchaeum sp.]